MVVPSIIEEVHVCLQLGGAGGGAQATSTQQTFTPKAPKDFTHKGPLFPSFSSTQISETFSGLITSCTPLPQHTTKTHQKPKTLAQGRVRSI